MTGVSLVGLSGFTVPIGSPLLTNLYGFKVREVKDLFVVMSIGWDVSVRLRYVCLEDDGGWVW